MPTSIPELSLSAETSIYNLVDGITNGASFKVSCSKKVFSRINFQIAKKKKKCQEHLYVPTLSPLPFYFMSFVSFILQAKKWRKVMGKKIYAFFHL